ncbi:Calx-beta domain-containing protein [Aquimonas voraii]|uniref:Calx-beta domain-containing protein n=1 Tax=Aquimonas voraii TaxID=265719 RepID=A0A1G6XDY8_9GAMM|nr:Calx-beta domain-containing protein [Aquimonas voraii]
MLHAALRTALAALLAVLLLAVPSGAAFGQALASADGLWTPIDEAQVARSAEPRRLVPQRYRTQQLDRARLADLLKSAPLEAQTAAVESSLELSLPTPEGDYARFRIVESPIMEAALAAKFPEIRTYLGQGIDDPTATLRFDVSPQGFRAQVIGWRGSYYVDPYQPKDLDTYVVYSKRDAPDDGERPRCGVTGQALPKDLPNFQQKGAAAKISSGTVRRTYRLAVAATAEYTAFHGGTVADGLAAIVTTMNRVNGIYERELSVRMVLVADNDRIIYTNAATDPYTNTSGSTMLGENVANLNTVIGSANFDIGHVVSTGGGGIAGLGVVCSSSKARGVTGSGSPVADPFDVDYVAHEMGHQFAGNHTFNGSGGSCSGGNRNGNTAYEPGSGITIQAYAGICGADNLQPNSDDYFHRVSLNEMLAFTTTGGGSNCGTTNATGNTPPTISTPAAWTIPSRTPFELTATGSDDNSDTLSYLWEQFDRGTSANVAGTIVDAGQGPLFRSFAPTLSSSRVFPSWRWILNNANVAPATAPLPGTSSPNWLTAEVLPSTNRTLNFRVTARDNRAGGGGTNEASTAVTVVAAAGPFAVTAPNTAASWAAGSLQTVTWNVAGTTANGINTANVRITLSLDGGRSWPIELAASTANDGSEELTLPANLPASTQARVRVQAVGNIFFDVSDANFSVTAAGNTPPSVSVTGALSTRQGSPAATANVATVSDAQQSAGSLAVAISGAPPGLAVSAVNSGGTVSLSATASCELVAPNGNRAYPLQLSVTDSGGATTTADVVVNVSRNQVPSLGAYANQILIRGASQAVTPSAAVADANGNLLGVSVTPTSLDGGGSVSVASNGTVTLAVGATTPFGAYPITVEAADSCGAIERRSFTLTVANAEPALEVASTSLPTGNGLVEPNECNQFNVSLRNNGAGAATAVSATLATTTPGVTISQASTSFADIAGNGDSQTSQTPFQISTSDGLTCFGNIDLQLTVDYSGGGGPFSSTIQLPVGQAASPNYTFTPSSGATLPGGGTLVAGTQVDDAVVNLSVPAGFAFSVYGQSYTGGETLRVSTNGNLQLVGTGGSSGWTNTALPSAGNADGGAGAFPASNAVLMPYWDDLDLRTAGSPGAGVYQQVLGTAPNRRWLIEWRGKHVQDTAVAQTVNFAIEFVEGSEAFSYLYAQTGSANANGVSATVGAQAATTGSVFTQLPTTQGGITPGLRLSASRPAGICSQGNGGCGPQVSVVLIESGGNTTATEGGDGDTYTVSLSAPPSGTVSFTASPDAQLQLSQTTLQFDALNWNLPQTITVSAVNDSVVEGPHTGMITHSVSGGGYAGVSVAPITVAITDNDSATLSTAPVLVAEGDSATRPLTFTLQLNGQVAGGFDVAYATRGDTAVAGQDFVASSGSLSFDGSVNPSQTLIVQVIGDSEAEADERFFLDLSTSQPGIVLNPASAIGEIVNDDFVADLRLSLARLPGLVLADAPVSYVIDVENASGVLAVPQATVTFTPATQLQGLSWTCTASAGSSCSAASGSGALPSLALGISGSARLQITATVAAGTALGTRLTSTATVSPVAPFTDPMPANNSASLQSTVGLDDVFADGFE